MNLSELNEVVSILRQSAEVDTSFCSMFQSDFPECVDLVYSIECS